MLIPDVLFLHRSLLYPPHPRHIPAASTHSNSDLCLFNSTNLLDCLGSPYLHCGLESASREEASVIVGLHLLLFLPLSHFCTACCPMSGNSCFVYFVLTSNALRWEINPRISHSILARVEQCCQVFFFNFAIEK